MNLTEADYAVAPELRDLTHENVRKVLNNFMFNFPTVSFKIPGRSIQPKKTSHNLRISEELGKQDIKYAEIGRWVTSGTGNVKSERKGQQTPKEFIAEVEKTIQEIDLTIEQVSIAGTKFWIEAHTPHNFEEFVSVLLPVYIALRKKGYTWHDLTG